MIEKLFSIEIPKKLIVLRYQFIDYLDLIFNPYDIFNSDKEEIDKAIKKVASVFKKNGWEGGGNIGVIWLPPFLDQAKDDYYGSFIWHVKQSNDGISFLGVKEPIQSAKILDQNQYFIENGKKVQPINIIYTVEKNLLKQLNKVKKLLQEVESSIESKIISEELNNLTLGYLQNEIVSNLNDFIDECYLQYLVHVLSHGNPDSINLRSMNAKISLDQISEKNNDFSGDHWLTINHIISNIWKDFKFLPFKDKFKEINKCIDYKHDPARISDINKHIVIRNCIQHHQWILVEDVLKTIGLDKIRILNNQGKYYSIEKWKVIKITPEEVGALIDVIVDYCIEYTKYVKKRIKTRGFMHNYEEDDYEY